MKLEILILALLCAVVCLVTVTIIGKFAKLETVAALRIDGKRQTTAEFVDHRGCGMRFWF